MSCCFAIFADDGPADRTARPIACFESLEDALDWGARRFAGRSFRIRYLPMQAGEYPQDPDSPLPRGVADA